MNYNTCKSNYTVIFRANQWTDFYMIGTSVMKELISSNKSQTVGVLTKKCSVNMQQIYRRHPWNNIFLQFLKVELSPSKEMCFICFNKSLLKLMKNVFYFILKTLFVLKQFKFLFWFFRHIEKMGWSER